MYIDNKEFLDIYANIILNKKNNQIFFMIFLIRLLKIPM